MKKEELSVHITRIIKDGILRHLHGYADYKDEKLDFEGVLWEDQIGGPNVHAKFTENSRKKLDLKGYDQETISEIEMKIQLKILNGEVIIEANKVEDIDSISS